MQTTLHHEKYNLHIHFYVMIIFCFSRFLYPRSDTSEREDEANEERVQRGQPDGKYELHARVNDCVTEELKDLILNGNGLWFALVSCVGENNG